MLLKKLLRTSSGRNLDYYDSINDLPLVNWWKFNETKDFGHLLKEYKDVDEAQMEHLSAIYTELMDEFTKEFGISNHLLAVIEKQIEIALLKTDYVLGEKGNTTLIEVAELELKELVKSVNGMSHNQIKAIIEKNMGFRVDPKVTTVMEYYSYIQLIDGKENK